MNYQAINVSSKYALQTTLKVLEFCMDRLTQLYNKLGLNKQNGLFILKESTKWIHKFPYRIGRILEEVIKPDAFFCLYNDGQLAKDHPHPFNQGFIFFFDNPSAEEEELIHSRVINFGLALAVFINRKETLDLFHGNDFNLKQLKKINSSANIFDFSDFSFTNQITGKTLKILGQKKKLIDEFLLSNITDARRILIAPDGLKLLPQAANRLIGRLLFISYLIDRGVTFGGQEVVVGRNKIERKARFREIISNKILLYDFFEYLNNKYNGDMFPLLEIVKGEIIYDERKIVKSDHLDVLSDLFNCSKFFKDGRSYNGYFVQKSLFDLYDFEIIPVELISSIYENFIGNEFENEKLRLSKQKEIKAYYTPPYLVDYVLSQTVSPFLKKKSKKDSNCRVLDPACGSGIFLVETLRKIVEKERLNSERNKIPDSKLWKLIKDNIFGIDIDSDAIEITIFSLYVTILDYKQPAEIEKFKFQKLKDENLFGGVDADFFNVSHDFNKKIKNINFIIGNPPWGKVASSRYIEYVSLRNKSENQEKGKDEILKVEIGDKEICQAFMLRTSDFISNHVSLICCLVVSSKVLYNTQSSSKNFRNYFLRKFSIKQVVELSPVNNKIRGGNHIFDNARQPAAILTFIPQHNTNICRNSIIQHITVKPNKFFIYYKSIVIEKHDVKYIKQEYFIKDFGGYDWLWKVLVHGNVLDIHFLKRLKQNEQTLQFLIDEGDFEFKGGLKVTDGTNLNSSNQINNYDYLDAEHGFRPYSTFSSKKWSKVVKDTSIPDGCVGYLPDLRFFEGEKLLIKKGIVLEPKKQLSEWYFQGVSAYSDSNICFTSTVCSIKKLGNSSDSKGFLAALSGLFNSTLFTYFLLNTSSSAGIERSRIHFDDFLNFPIKWNNKLGELVLKITNQFDNFSNPIINNDIIKEIEAEVIKIYELSSVEKALLEFAAEVSIPILLRQEDTNIFKPLNLNSEKDRNYIEKYVEILLTSFEQRFIKINKRLICKVRCANNFIRVDFNISSQKNKSLELLSIENDDLELLLGDLGIYQVCKDLYFQQDVRGFTDNSFYIIKPNEKKLWHSAIAYLDALEFDEAFTKAELDILKKKASK